MNEKLTREEMNQSVDTYGDILHVEERNEIIENAFCCMDYHLFSFKV